MAKASTRAASQTRLISIIDEKPRYPVMTMLRICHAPTGIYIVAIRSNAHITAERLLRFHPCTTIPTAISRGRNRTMGRMKTAHVNAIPVPTAHFGDGWRRYRISRRTDSTHAPVNAVSESRRNEYVMESGSRAYSSAAPLAMLVLSKRASAKYQTAATVRQLMTICRAIVTATGDPNSTPGIRSIGYPGVRVISGSVCFVNCP
jgi:hypothetical protein